MAETSTLQLRLGLNSRKSAVIFFTLRASLSAFWAVAAAAKAISLPLFASVLERIFPWTASFSDVLAITVVALEALVAIGFCFQRSISLATLLSCVLPSAFAAINVINLTEGIGTPCGCFGKVFTLNPWTGLFLNAVIFSASLYIAAQARPNGGNP